jgi:hypothetical protein
MTEMEDPFRTAEVLRLLARERWPGANVTYLRRTRSGRCLFRVYEAPGVTYYLGLAAELCDPESLRRTEEILTEIDWLDLLRNARPAGLLVTPRSVVRWDPATDAGVE